MCDLLWSDPEGNYMVLPSLQAKYFLPFIISWLRTVCVAVKQVCFQALWQPVNIFIIDTGNINVVKVLQFVLQLAYGTQRIFESLGVRRVQ